MYMAPIDTTTATPVGSESVKGGVAKGLLVIAVGAPLLALRVIAYVAVGTIRRLTNFTRECSQAVADAR